MPRFELVGLVLLAGTAAAQAPVLSPTVSTTIDVDATFGHLTYASITIPAGVEVRFTGHYPVRVVVHGDVRVDGTLSVVAVPALWVAQTGPGGVSTGAGFPGYYWWFGSSGYSGSPAESGRHASRYGSAVPFDLAGGSVGGDAYFYGGPIWFPSVGGGGGGTLTIEAAGRIEVLGVVTADGSPGAYLAGTGSGGSILLRGLLGCSLAAGSLVTAEPDGIVRLDAYDVGPQIAGVVQPPPTIVRLPDLVETVPPQIGSTWQLRVLAPRGDVVFLAASFQPGSGTTQYGTYGIDLASAITFAQVALPGLGHDPIATFELSLPNAPYLVGLPLWVQGLDWYTTLPPRYTQTLHTVVR